MDLASRHTVCAGGADAALENATESCDVGRVADIVTWVVATGGERYFDMIELPRFPDVSGSISVSLRCGGPVN